MQVSPGRIKRMYPEGGIAAGPAKEFIIEPTRGDQKRSEIKLSEKARNDRRE